MVATISLAGLNSAVSECCPRRYLVPSIKGEVLVDRDYRQPRNQRACRGLLRMPTGSSCWTIALLKQLIRQDVEGIGKETTIQQGITRDLVISVHDPEMRRGRKSVSCFFSGRLGGISLFTRRRIVG